MSSEIDALVALLPPQPGSAAPREWSAVEEEMGVQLPADYKGLVGTYGSSALDDFIWILQPSANDSLDLVKQTRVRLAALEQLRLDGEEIPSRYPLGALIPWAVTDNGDVCYWLVDPPARPELWNVVVNASRAPIWEFFDGSATEFLLAIFTRSYRSAVFPADFPSTRP